jgi:hypothetical protein
MIHPPFLLILYYTGKAKHLQVVLLSIIDGKEAGAVADKV